MNAEQCLKTIELFKKVGFPNVTKKSLETLNDHFLNANKRIVMIISHTTTHDFLLGLLLFGQSSIPITMFTDFKSPILKQFATRLGMLTREKNTSNTESIIKHLEQRTEFGLLIALGKTQRNEKIHSGYFHIARALQAPIIVLGFDYFLKTGTVSNKSWLPFEGQTYEHFRAISEKQILQEIQGICPFKPDFQTGFVASLYPHADLTDVTLTAPNMASLYAHVAKQQCANYVSESTVLLWVLFGLFLVFVILAIVCQYKK